MLLIGALEGRRYYLPNQRSLKLSKLNTFCCFFFPTCFEIVDLKEKPRRRSIRGRGTQEGEKKKQMENCCRFMGHVLRAQKLIFTKSYDAGKVIKVTV